MWTMHRNATGVDTYGGSTLSAIARERHAIAGPGSCAGAHGAMTAQPTRLSIDVPAKGDVCPQLEAIV